MVGRRMAEWSPKEHGPNGGANGRGIRIETSKFYREEMRSDAYMATNRDHSCGGNGPRRRWMGLAPAGLMVVSSSARVLVRPGFEYAGGAARHVYR